MYNAGSILLSHSNDVIPIIRQVGCDAPVVLRESKHDDCRSNSCDEAYEKCEARAKPIVSCAIH